MRQLAKHLIKFLLMKIGGFHPSRMRSDMSDVLNHMKSNGFNPVTVFDIGVASGTDELYRAFPGARFVLVEPLQEFQPYIEGLRRRYDVVYEIAAAADNVGEITLNVHDDLCGSSVLKEVEGGSVDGVPRRVPAVTLDVLVDRYDLSPPYFIKIDVQGGELQVLKGAEKTLNLTEAITLEVSLFGFFEEGPQLHDVIHFMRERGFVVYEIFDGKLRPLDGALAQVDMLFVRENGKFRKSHAYANSMQRLAQDIRLRKEMGSVS